MTGGITSRLFSASHGALHNGAPFNELPESIRQLLAWLLKRPGGDQEMMYGLALVLLLDVQRVVRDIAEVLKCDINLQAVCT